MKKITTIQKRQKLNDVYVCDEKGPGGAYHRYIICKTGETAWQNGNNDTGILEEIRFQKGPRKDENSQLGILDTDLLEIVRHRLQCFQQGEYSTRENAIALTHIEEALLWLNKRVEDRIERNVLGTTKV
jgi:hypothetical protein